MSAYSFFRLSRAALAGILFISLAIATVPEQARADALKGGLIGGSAGAIIGSIVGGSGGAVAGAVIGGSAGAIIGDDRKRKRKNQKRARQRRR